MTYPSDYFTEISKFVIIFDNQNSSLFWKADSLKNIGERADLIIKNKYDLELQTIFLKRKPKQQEELAVALEALRTINSFCLRAYFFDELHAKLKKLKKDDDKELTRTINNHADLLDLLQSVSLSIKVLRERHFKVTMVIAKMCNRNSLLFKKIS